MKALALLAIRGYQRYLSPRKGFCCAYAAFTGHASCSALGYRAIRRFGVIDGIALLDRRLYKCGVAYRRHRPAAPRALGRQGGFLDCACDAPGDCSSPCNCGLPDACAWPQEKSCPCDLSSDCSCDLGDCDRKRRKHADEDERYVVIPPGPGLRGR